MRLKVPFGVGQVGKSFRNEITPGNFIFRVREFEQMELEFFCKPGTELGWHQYYKNACKKFLLDLGIKEENLRFRDHSPEELSFYSNATTDIEYKFPFGWGELWVKLFMIVKRRFVKGHMCMHILVEMVKMVLLIW